MKPSTQILIDAVVHAVNEDYREMANDFIKLVRAHVTRVCDVCVRHVC